MKTILKSCFVFATCVALIPSLLAQYVEVDLTGYKAGQGTRYIDPNLNGWGMVQTPNGQFCVANTATGVATFYDRSGKPQKLIITIPPAPSQPFGPVGTPTGVVYNSTRDFVISAHGKSAPARLIFDTLDGTISGWNPSVDPTRAIIIIDNSNESPYAASYTGLAIGRNSRGQNVLYAADSGNGPDISNNRIDMFDGHFHSIGSFTDPNVASQYPGNTVFQVENEDGQIFVTFAGFSPPFGGVVDIFDRDGHLLTPNHFAANAGGAGPLVNPWAVTKAPHNFGGFKNAILIGNVEDGRISAYSESGEFLGQLQRPNGTPLAIKGLWDFTFEAETKEHEDSNRLFFTAGPDASDFAGNGLFGFVFPAGHHDRD
jgi:uncharacterized protein (TIGR03118 family)